MKKIFTLLASFAFLLAFSFTFTRIQAAEPTVDDDVTITIKAYFENSNKNIGQAPIVVKYGAGRVISLETDISGTSSYAFAYWIVNGIVRPDLAVGNSFVATNGLELTAVFTPTGFHAVVFADSNGKVMLDGSLYNIQYVATNGDASAPDTASFTKPGYTISETPWSSVITNITANTVAKLQYTLSNAASLTANVTGGTADKVSYAYNEVATLTAGTAPEGQVFSHWAIGTRIISRSEVYKVTMLDDLYIEAVFLSSALSDTPLITISDTLSLTGRSGYVSYKGQVYLPAGYELIEYGLLTSASLLSSFDLNTASGVTKNQANSMLTSTKEFLISISTANGNSARGYIVVKNPSNQLVTYYSDISISTANHLVINEVYGGGGNAGSTYKNDYIEIYNPTSKPIEVSNYSIQYASSSGTTWQKTNLVGTIAPYSYFLVQQAAGSGGTTNLPTPDIIGTIAMSGTAGKIALVNNQTLLTGAQTSDVRSTSVVDFVGFGTATAYEGTSGTPAPSNTASVSRKEPFFDTNNNNTDFGPSSSPSPRNSAYRSW